MQHITDILVEYIHRNMVDTTAKIINLTISYYIYIKNIYQRIRVNLFSGAHISLGGLVVSIEDHFRLIAQRVVAMVGMVNKYGSRQHAMDVAA